VNEQLDFFGFGGTPTPQDAPRPTARKIPTPDPIKAEPPPERQVISTVPLQELAQSLLRQLGNDALAKEVRVLWNPRMRSTAGLAYPGKSLILLNPKLHAFEGELDRTMRHELAHLLAHHRAGKRRISAHGPEWRQACVDLGLVNETRCHSLPLPKRKIARKYAYVCPGCAVVLRRVRPLNRKSACLACCRLHNGGKYHDRFRLKPMLPA
jgi:predicted SprT family Zn-dependent metalloprotease